MATKVTETHFLTFRRGTLTEFYHTKTLRSLSHMFLVTVVDTTVLPNNELTAQNQIDWKHRIKQIP